MWMVSRGLQVRVAAEILSEREPAAVVPLCVAQAGTHERAASRSLLVPGEAL